MDTEELQIKCQEPLLWNGLETQTGTRDEGILRQALLSPEKEGQKDGTEVRVRIEQLDTMKKRLEERAFFDSEVTIEANGGLVPEGSEYTVHLLSQISSSILPTMSSSQVSSVLSALEPHASFEPKNIIPREKSPGQVLSEFLKLDRLYDKEEKDRKNKPVECVQMQVNKISWFKCPACAFLSLRQESVLCHYREAHDGADFRVELKCIGCALEFKSAQALTSHFIFDHHTPPGEAHDLLKMTVEVNKIWEEEEKTKVLDEERERECDKILKENGDDKLEVESKCEKLPSSKAEKTLKCGIDRCSVRFASFENLRYHRSCHLGGSAWKCPECSTVFQSWSNLANHAWKAHAIDLELYACGECSYKTDSMSKLLNLHKRIHGEERPFGCETCDKHFKTKKQLRNHKVIHKNKTVQRLTLNCSLCSRTFRDPKMLNNHMDSVHKGLRPFLCSTCGYTAASRSSLRMHARAHSGEKPYKCVDCDYATSDHNSLRRHRMRHTGDKHYKCPHCPYACIQSTTYKAHLYNKHPGKDEGLMFSCSLCPFKTVNKENFLTHTSYHAVRVDVGKQEAKTPTISEIEFSLHDFVKNSSPDQQSVKNANHIEDEETPSGTHFLSPRVKIVKSEVLLNDRMLSESRVPGED
ncbi:zinc finger protein 845-like [Cimex lectularius]|uniref:C2H2-type domain-containing protein n=1 Tax=Cimex lectularius TaxID=79782 RepID=A0A8I6S6B2_CIMLE|nr:zinc finger protein 845-like [Cimex lectularius]